MPSVHPKIAWDQNRGQGTVHCSEAESYHISLIIKDFTRPICGKYWSICGKKKFIGLWKGSGYPGDAQDPEIAGKAEVLQGPHIWALQYLS